LYLTEDESDEEQQEIEEYRDEQKKQQKTLQREENQQLEHLQHQQHQQQLQKHSSYGSSRSLRIVHSGQVHSGQPSSFVLSTLQQLPREEDCESSSSSSSSSNTNSSFEISSIDGIKTATHSNTCTNSNSSVDKDDPQTQQIDNNNDNNSSSSSNNNKLHLISTWFFLLGTCLYIAVAVTELQFFASLPEKVPTQVLYADDDYTWWDFLNETDGGPIAPNDWYSNNNRTFLTDDYVFPARPFQAAAETDQEVLETTTTTTAWVSRYQILYFAAAFCFLVTGSLEVLLAVTHGYPWTTKVLYGIMVLASLFGIGSSMLVEWDSHLSSILNSVSVHLFALEAIFIALMNAEQENNDSNNNDEAGESDGSISTKSQNQQRNPCCGISVNFWYRVGDLCFLIGTMMDVSLSYFYVYETAILPHSYAAVVAAGFWWLCAMIYFSLTIQSYCSSRNSNDEDRNVEGETNHAQSKKDHPSLEYIRTWNEEDEKNSILL